MTHLKDRCALVTGAGTGVGRCVAMALSQAGASIALAGRRIEPLRDTAQTIEAEGGRALGISCDVSDVESVSRMTDQIRAELGAPLVVVNNAGVHGEFTLIRDSDPARFTQTMMVNALGPYLVTRSFLPDMLQAGWGRIINVTSASSLGAPNGMNAAYPLSKVTLNHFTRQLAAELEGTGVTANVFHPGEVKTEMWAAIRNDSVEHGVEGGRQWAKMVEETGGDPPKKSAELVMRLVGPEGDGINGQFLWIEGGLQDPLGTW